MARRNEPEPVGASVDVTLDDDTAEDDALDDGTGAAVGVAGAHAINRTSRTPTMT